MVECASPDAVRAFAEQVLSRGKDLLMMSSGALTEPALVRTLANVAERSGCRLLVPSGALGGIDAIRAVRDRLREVTLTTTKPPGGLRGAPGFKEWESREITRPEVVFEGTAMETVKLFPANVNVSAAVSLAGIGPDRTQIRILAVPGLKRNCHDVEIEGEFGRLAIHIENVPTENPRTGRLTILSMIRAVQDAMDPVRIGT